MGQLREDAKVRAALEAAKEQAALTDAVRSTARMLAVLDSHLQYLEAKQAKAGLEYLQIPSRNQQYFHVMDSGGVVRVQQDAAFVVEQVFITSIESIGINGTYFSMTDVSAYRSVTVGARAGGNNVFSSATAMPTDSVLVPTKVLVPQISDYTSNGLNDYWYVLPVEWQLPRGGALQFAFMGDSGSGHQFNDPASYTVTVSGYKVFA